MSNDAQVKYIVYTICYLIISLCLMFNILIKYMSHTFYINSPRTKHKPSNMQDIFDNPK